MGNSSSNSVFVVDGDHLITIEIKKTDDAREVPYVKKIQKRSGCESINNYHKYTVDQEILPEWVHKNTFGGGYQIILPFYKTLDNALNEINLHVKEYIKSSLTDEYYYCISEYCSTDKIRIECNSKLRYKTIGEYNNSKLHGKLTKYKNDIITSVDLYQDGLLHGISYEKQCRQISTIKTINTDINYKASIVKQGKVEYVYNTKQIECVKETHGTLYTEFSLGTFVKSWFVMTKENIYEKDYIKSNATPV